MAPESASTDSDCQAAAGEHPAERLAHVPIRLLVPRLVLVERVGVQHQELAPANQAAARARLIAELGLDLVRQERQLFVRLNIAPRDGRDDFFVREAQKVVMRLDREQHIHFVPARLFQNLAREQRRHQHLDAADAVHLLAQDVGDLVQHSQAERQVGVNAAGEGPDKAAAQEQLMADQLRLAAARPAGWGQKVV